jgi:hypothetical protein
MIFLSEFSIVSHYVYQLRVEGQEVPFYIGISFVGSRRLNEHLCDARKRDAKTIKAHIIRKAWRNGLKIVEDVLATVETEKMAQAIEIALIGQIGRRCDGTGPLANLTLGGEGANGLRHTEATKAIMSEKKIGNKINVGRKRPDMTDRFSKPVTIYGADGVPIGQYTSQRSAATELGIDYRLLNQVLLGKSRTTRTEDGLVIQAKMGHNVEVIPPIVHRQKKTDYRIVQLNPDGSEVASFRTCTEASKNTGIAASSIQMCVNGQAKTAGKFHWRKEHEQG